MRIRINVLREVLIIGSSLALLRLAVVFDRRATGPFYVTTLRNPRAASRNPFDILASDRLDDATARIADLGLYGGPALPLLLISHPRLRPQRPALLLIWFETMLLTFALTSVIKNRASRPRPYVLHREFPAQQALNRNDRAAFLSGHTALAAAGSLLFAQLIYYYFTQPALHRTAWFVGGLVPGFTGFLRVKSAKHWPTDALGGLLLGAFTSTTVLSLHLDEVSRQSQSPYYHQY